MYDNNDYLAHHGIKGQKWGVRRFQNPDGSLTDEGRKRYGSTQKLNQHIKDMAAAIKKKISTKQNLSDEEAREKLKEYVRKHPKKLEKYSKVLTKDEVNEVIENIRFDRRIQDIKQEEIQRGWAKLQRFNNNMNSLSSMINNSKNLYNNTAEIYNSLVDNGVITSASKMTKIGEKDRSAIQKIVRSGSASDVLNNISNMTSSELEAAMKRLNYEDNLRRRTSSS